MYCKKDAMHLGNVVSLITIDRRICCYGPLISKCEYRYAGDRTCLVGYCGSDLPRLLAFLRGCTCKPAGASCLGEAKSQRSAVTSSRTGGMRVVQALLFDGSSFFVWCRPMRVGGPSDRYAARTDPHRSARMFSSSSPVEVLPAIEDSSSA